MASLKGWRSASTDEPVSAGELARLGATMASLELVLPLLCGGALPHRKLIRSSRRMVLRRFFTQANISWNTIQEQSIIQMKNAALYYIMKNYFITLFGKQAPVSSKGKYNVETCPDTRKLHHWESRHSPCYGVGGRSESLDQNFSDGLPHSLRW